MVPVLVLFPDGGFFLGVSSSLLCSIAATNLGEGRSRTLQDAVRSMHFSSWSFLTCSIKSSIFSNLMLQVKQSVLTIFISNSWCRFWIWVLGLFGWDDLRCAQLGGLGVWFADIGKKSDNLFSFEIMKPWNIFRCVVVSKKKIGCILSLEYSISRHLAIPPTQQCSYHQLIEYTQNFFLSTQKQHKNKIVKERSTFSLKTIFSTLWFNLHFLVFFSMDQSKYVFHNYCGVLI